MQTRSIERRAAILGRVGILAGSLLAGGCAQILGMEDIPSGFAVRGTAVGVLGPVDLELRMADDTELLTVAQDGTFAFDTWLDTGASYTVALPDSTVPCTLRKQTGMVADADTAIELTCTGPSLASVVVYSIVARRVALVPGTTDYVLDLSVWEQEVRLVATVATPGDTMAIKGAPAVSGEPSEELTLSPGENPVDIVVENDLGWQRTYRVTLRRPAQSAQ